MFITEIMSRKLCMYLKDRDIIEENVQPYYEYAFDFVLDITMFNGSLFLLGVFMRVPILSLLYIFTLTPLKMLSGGIHAPNRISCSLISYIIFFTVILLTKHEIFIFRPWTAIIIYALCMMLISIATPVDCQNKRIKKEKRRYYKIRCILLIVLLTVFFSFFIYTNSTQYYSIMVINSIIISINQIIGILINRASQHKCFTSV